MSVRIPYSGVTFESGYPYVTAWTGFGGLRKLDLGPDTLAFSTSKTVNDTTGNFTVTLLPRSEAYLSELTLRTPSEKLPYYFRALRPNTPISIGFDREGGIMFGLVASCSYTSMVVNNTASIGLQVVCTDMGHVLDDQVLQALITNIDLKNWTEAIGAVLGKDAPILKELMGAEGPINAANERSLILAPLDRVAEYNLTRVTGMRIPVLKDAYGGKGAVSDFTIVKVTSFANDLVYKPDLYQQAGTISGYFNEVIDQDFYEYRMETIPQANGLPRPALIIRPKPFDEIAFTGPAWPKTVYTKTAAWEELTTLIEGLHHHQIDTGDLTGEMSLGRSRDEAFSYYTVQNNNQIGSTAANMSAGMAYPLYDLYNGTSFVTKRYDSRCSLIPGDPTAKSMESQIGNAMQDRRNRLFCWYRANPDFLNGSIQVRGKDTYRAGDPVWIPWLQDPLSGQPGVRFYCTAVQHSWSFGGRYNCMLSLSRGHGAGFWEEYLRQVEEKMSASLPSPVVSGKNISRLARDFAQHALQKSNAGIAQVTKYGWVSADR